ncbi:hypothetical protein GCM10023196_039340 [Actinoallomurus vinaceus]|uniref:WD40 repeat domain-containing protein n=2 Tax=Actinoallomurus vinaceus TaxID=1080074 RepID=A0ABP8UBN1_9ACTN
MLSSEVPSGSRITDFTVVQTAAGPLIICADSRYGGVWTWDPLRDVWQDRPLAFACAGDPVAAQYPDAENDIDSVAAVVSGGRVVLAAGGDEQGIALWDLESGELIRGASFNDDYTAAITAVRGEGPPLFVTATQYAEEVLVWRPSAEEPLTELPNDIGEITGLTAAHGHGLSMAAAGGADGVVAVWDLAQGESLASFYTEAGHVPAVSLARLAAGPVVAAAVEDGIYVWDVTGDPESDPVHDPLTGHEETIRSLDTVTFDDRCLAVTGGDDATVRVWDLRTGAQVGDPLSGHKGSVETVRTAVLDGRHVALSAGRDGRINVWDLHAMVRTWM